MKITGDKDLDELLNVITNTINRIGSYEIKPGDRFEFVPRAKPIIRKALQRYLSKKIQAFYSKI